MTNDEPQFGIDDCTCIPFTRQTNPPRYLNRPTDTVDMISGWERGRDCPHHAPAVPVSSPPPVQTAEELATARATNRRLNLRAQALESELAAYRRAVAQWKISETGTYVPLRTLAVIAKVAGLDVPDRWELHYERVERAEAELRRLAAEAPQPDTETQACAHSDGCDRECPCPPSCGCCTVTAAPDTEMPNTDRAAVYREVADRLTTDAHGMQPDWARIYKRDAAVKVREWADRLDGEGRQDDSAHSCGNCDGIDPGTCLMNPNRPPEQCPRSEFDGYGLQCQKPAGHNLCTFEEQPSPAHKGGYADDRPGPETRP